jgi:hypothetical protein
LVLRKDKKGRYWLTRYRGENAGSLGRVTVHISDDLALMLEAIVDASHADGQLHLEAPDTGCRSL